MKKITCLISLIFTFAVFSCGHHEGAQQNISYSYELDVTGRDTFNLICNGLKQGMWIETHEGKKDTVYYRNDTLISK